MNMKREDISEEQIEEAAIIQGVTTTNALYTVKTPKGDYRKKNIAAGKALKFSDCYVGKKGQMILIFDIENGAVSFKKETGGGFAVMDEVQVEIEMADMDTMTLNGMPIVSVLVGKVREAQDEKEYAGVPEEEDEFEGIAMVNYGAFS